MKKGGFLGLCLFSALAALGAENHSFKVGQFELSAVQDVQSAMGAQLFPQVSQAEFVKIVGADRAPASVNTFLLKKDGKNILIDAGNGGQRGNMLSKLAADGITPAQIDFILITHMHGDHIGGLLDKDGQAVFPRAMVYVSAPEMEYRKSSADKGNATAQKIFRAYGTRVKTFRFGEEVLPGLRALDASGHTPGHTVFETDSLLIVGDLLHAAALQIPRPDVCASFDMDKDKAVQARKRFYRHAATSAKLIVGMHLPYPGLGHISATKDGYTYTPRDEKGENK